MSRLALIGCLALLAAGCAPRGRQARPAPPVSGVVATFQRQVINAVDAGEGDLAIRDLRRRLASDPGNPAVRLELIRRYREAGFPEVALEHARLAAERFPENPEVRIELAKCLRVLGLRAEAAEILESFFRDHPRSSPEVPAWLGILRDELGQWPQGEAAHRAALALAPGRDYLHNNLGYNLLRQGRLQEGRQALERALQLNPNSAAARNNLGLALAAEGAPALDQFQKAGDPAAAHNNLACALIEQGRYAEARKELEIALGYSRNHPAALANLKLISELDGRGTGVELGQAPRSGWSRFWWGVWRILAGVEQDKSQRPQR
jgi:Flp pilus assembly protein TadD